MRDLRHRYITIKTPVPPSLNNAYFTSGNRRVLSSEGATFKSKVIDLAIKEAERYGFKIPKGARLGFEMQVHFANRRPRDLDNCVKLPLDALATALEFNDSIVDELIVRRGHPIKDNPHAGMTLYVLED
jgi:Holliday junction resolvase RusA-like endonuclease